MGITFELKERDGLGRICRLGTAHGTVTTPALLPVVNPNKLSITPRELKETFGAEIIITNAYIINSTARLRERALAEGVHRLVDFDGPIMTDSGAFQAYVYKDKEDASVEISAKGIVEFQRDIGVDIGTILDIITDKYASWEEAKADVDETIARAKGSIDLKGDMALAGTVQGSVYPDLREGCARAMGDMDLDVHPIGGVVPLMEDYRYKNLVQAIIGAKKGLPSARPVHLFGAGHPHVLSIAVLLGCDLFDSSSYMKYAMGDRMMFNDCTRRLEDMAHLPCHCPVCVSTDVKELKAMGKKERQGHLARHNLYILFGKINAIRQAIYEERLWEMAERDARGHPALLEALQSLEKEGDYLERFESTSRTSAFMHTGPESRHRPIVRRYRERLLKRYSLPRSTAMYVVPEAKKPYHVTYNALVKLMEDYGLHFSVDSYFGPVPLELDLMYPLAQSMSAPITLQEKKELVDLWSKFEEANRITFEQWSEDEEKAMKKGKGKRSLDIDMLRVEAVARMQFGPRAASALLDGEVTLRKSHNGRIRNVLVDGDHVLSMRAHDGMYTLKVAGARRMLKAVKAPAHRVVADKDAAPFVKEGKNLFAKFVQECDGDLRPGDEAVVVDPDGNLLAVGRVILNKEEISSFKQGVAVKTREHV